MAQPGIAFLCNGTAKLRKGIEMSGGAVALKSEELLRAEQAKRCLVSVGTELRWPGSEVLSNATEKPIIDTQWNSIAKRWKSIETQRFCNEKRSKGTVKRRNAVELRGGELLREALAERGLAANGMGNARQRDEKRRICFELPG